MTSISRRLSACADRLVMFVHTTSLSRGFALWTSLWVAIIVLLAGESGLAYRRGEDAAERAARTLAFASELRALGDRELNAVLYLSSGLAAYFVVHRDAIDPAEVNGMLEAVFRQGQHLRVVSVAVGYRAEYVFPVAGNEAVLGQDYRKLPAQWPRVKLAIEKRAGVLTGPVNLVQGGTALIYRVPIFANEKYWGFLSTVIDMASFNSAAFKGVSEGQFAFAVRSVEDDTTSGGMLWGKAALFDDPRAVRLESRVPNGLWEYAVLDVAAEDKRIEWLWRVMLVSIALLGAWATYTVLAQRRALTEQAGLDSLTGLPNRRLFDDRLDQCLRRHARDDGGGVAVIFLDLNGFKQFNDRYGHRFGDGVLLVVARRLRDEVRLADTVSRWAGDEFVLIIEDASVDEVLHLMTRLRSIVAAPFRVAGVPVTVTGAFGAAFYPGDGISAEALLELADQRMYADKQAMSGTR